MTLSTAHTVDKVSVANVYYFYLMKSEVGKYSVGEHLCVSFLELVCSMLLGNKRHLGILLGNKQEIFRERYHAKTRSIHSYLVCRTRNVR